MMRIGIFLLSVATAFAQGDIKITSAASASAGLAPESLATITGTNLASEIETAGITPWPTMLGGASIQVADSAGHSRAAGLLYVSPTQINFEIPAGTAPGPATVSINNGSPVAIMVRAVAPALFAINADGIAAATAVRTVIPTGVQSPVSVFQCAGNDPSTCTLVPIDPGVDAPVTLTFYGTGIRGWSSPANVVVSMGNLQLSTEFAGPDPNQPGVDQVRVPLALSLRGSGEISVTVTVDGVTSNAVKISIR